MTRSDCHVLINSFNANVENSYEIVENLFFESYIRKLFEFLVLNLFGNLFENFFGSCFGNFFGNFFVHVFELFFLLKDLFSVKFYYF